MSPSGQRRHIGMDLLPIKAIDGWRADNQNVLTRVLQSRMIGLSGFSIFRLNVTFWWRCRFELHG